MTPCAPPELARRDRLGAAVCGALVAGQILLLGYLLQWHGLASVPLALLAGGVAARMLGVWLARAGDRRRVRLFAAMVAAGGFGMFAGCAIDLGSLGVYGLLQVCRSLSSVAPWPGPTELWLTMTLMPWACAGMLAGGTAGMAVVAILDRRPGPVGHLLGFHGACNVGMFVGMMIAEHAVAYLASGLTLQVAGALLLVAMLAGMTAGMSVLLMLAARVPRLGRVLAA